VHAFGINNNGVVVGGGTDSSGIQKGFIYDAGNYTELLPPGWSGAFAFDINDSGAVVGEYPFYQGGFIYHNAGTYTELFSPSGWSVQAAFSINNGGVVVGSGHIETAPFRQIGFMYDAGIYTELLPPGCSDAGAYGINDNGVVVGDAACGGLQKGFIATPKAALSCVSVSPSSGMQNQTLDVTIIGSNTNFIDTGSTANSTTVSFGCSGITVNSTTVSSTTEVTANITIARDAPLEICNVTVITGSEVVTCDDAFSTVQGTPFLTMTSPNGRESWKRNSKQTIRWNATAGLGNLRISLWQNTSQIGIITDNVTPDAGSYAWNVGVYNGGVAPLGAGYTIRIREKGTALSDESDTPFSIVKMSVKTPNGDESWQIGSTQNITWVAKSISGNLRIVLFKSGVKVGNIVNSISPSISSYSWTVGSYIGGTAAAGTGYQVQVREIGTDAGDRSDASFTLTAP
jgi:hypothetical protein